MATDPTCKPIGQAVIGTSFKIGCTPSTLPTFSPTSRKVNNEIKMYRKKLRKSGLLV